MMKLQRHCVSRDGFTLIEVLMAAFIIALGVLGLSALFAGAARQQQVATQTTSAVVVSNNAEAIVARNFGAIAGAALPQAEEGVWLPIPTPDSASGQVYSRDNYLSIDAADDGDVNGSLYFLVDEPQSATLLEAVQTSTASGVYRFTRQQLDNPGQMPPGFSAARVLSHSRIDPASISEIRMWIGPSNSTTDDRQTLVTFSYVSDTEIADFLNGPDSGFPSPLRGTAVADWNRPDNEGRTIVLFPNGIISFADYIVLDVGLAPQGSSGGLFANPEPARLRLVNYNSLISNPGLQLQIRRIEMGSYSWRNDRLISLEDRIVSKEDESSATGRRPDIGYSLLYRRFATGASQVGIFTYQLNAVDGQGLRPTTPVRAGEPLFVPQERLQDIGSRNAQGFNASSSKAPIRTAEAQLAYDDLNKVYYISVDPGAASRWIAEPGQLLVIAQRESPSQLTNRKTGSDQPVRVLRKTTLAGGRIRADLDRVPRAEGESMLPDLTQTEDITVWAVQETVKSRRGNATWKLSPLDFRVIQVR